MSVSFCVHLHSGKAAKYKVTSPTDTTLKTDEKIMSVAKDFEYTTLFFRYNE